MEKLGEGVVVDSSFTKNFQSSKRNSVKYEKYCISLIKMLVCFFCLARSFLLEKVLTQNAQFILNDLNDSPYYFPTFVHENTCTVLCYALVLDQGPYLLLVNT